MIRIYCPTCNGLVKLADNKKEAYCVNCGRKIRVPAGYSRLESSYLFAAEAMQRRDFAAAKAAYGEIAAANPDQAEAYFKRALADYEIEYQETADGNYRMVCHQAQKSDFLQSADVKRAISLASEEKKEEYLEQAKQVEALQKAVSAYAAGHPPVDVWLEAERGNLFSLDKTIQIRQLMENMSLSVFCPALDLEEDEADCWECALYRAASTAKAMVIVAVGADSFTDEVNFNVLRFLYLKEKAQREAKGRIPSLILAFDQLDEYEDIPDSWFDGLDERLYMGEESFAVSLRETLSGLRDAYGTTLHGQESGREDFSYTNRLLKARQTLESGDIENAKRQYSDILLRNPMESQAFWGLLLCSRGCASEQDLIESGEDITGENNYRNALAFANERQQQTYREVAAKIREMAGVYEAQAEEAKRQAAIQEEERKKKAREVKEEQQKKYKKEMRSRNRGTRTVRTIIIAIVVVAVVGFAASRIGNMIWMHSDAKAYQDAMAYYTAAEEKSNYSYAYTAYESFGELEDYKDSASMAAQALDLYYHLWTASLQETAQTISKRPSAIISLKECAQYVDEAQDILNELYEEGVALLEEGDYYSAFMTLKSFGRSDENFIKAWRHVFSMGMMAGGGDGKILGITSGGSLTYTEPLTYHSLGTDSVISVAISDSGNSWGCVRSDGTACLAGDVADVADVSAWENLICLKIDGTYVAALTADGLLYSASGGLLASDIIQFDMDGAYVAALRSDGTIFCNNPSVVFPAGWNDYSYVYVTILNDTVYAVTEEGYVCKTSNDLLMEYTDVVVIYHGQGKLGLICSDGTCYFGNGEDMESDGKHYGYFASFVSYQGITMRLYTTSDGSVEAMNDDFGEDAGTLKKWIRSMDDIGCPKF